MDGCEDGKDGDGDGKAEGNEDECNGALEMKLRVMKMERRRTGVRKMERREEGKMGIMVVLKLSLRVLKMKKMRVEMM